MKQIDILNWHEFVIRDLFEIKRPEARSQMDYDEGEVPEDNKGSLFLTQDMN